MDNVVKGLIIDKSDLKEAAEMVKNRLFMLGLYKLHQDVLIPKCDSYNDLYEVIMQGLKHNSVENCMATSLEELYGEEKDDIQRKINVRLKADNVTPTLKTIYSICCQACYKELGEFI